MKHIWGAELKKRSAHSALSAHPLSESALICSSFSPRRVILFCSEWLACCRGIMVILGSFYEFFTSDHVYLSGCLTAFNFEELIMHFIWLWKVIYIYFVEKDIQLYIIYGIQEPLGILLEWEHNVYLSSSEEVEVVSWDCWAEQPQSCSSSSFRNVTSRTPQRSRSQSGTPGPKTDLRIIIFKKKKKIVFG